MYPLYVDEAASEQLQTQPVDTESVLMAGLYMLSQMRRGVRTGHSEIPAWLEEMTPVYDDEAVSEWNAQVDDLSERINNVLAGYHRYASDDSNSITTTAPSPVLELLREQAVDLLDEVYGLWNVDNTESHGYPRLALAARAQAVMNIIDEVFSRDHETWTVASPDLLAILQDEEETLEGWRGYVMGIVEGDASGEEKFTLDQAYGIIAEAEETCEGIAKRVRSLLENPDLVDE